MASSRANRVFLIVLMQEQEIYKDKLKEVFFFNSNKRKLGKEVWRME